MEPVAMTPEEMARYVELARLIVTWWGGVFALAFAWAWRRLYQRRRARLAEIVGT